MKSIHHILIYVILLISGCIEEFDPPSEGFENLLVVEAFLTNDNQPFEVKLSRSMPLDTIAWIAESGAQVSISNGSGEEYGLEEIVDGSYQFPGNIPASPGESYLLQITTSNGNYYRSDQVTMRETPPIDSVTWQYEEKPFQDLQGIQIYINTHDPDNNTWYYRWEWEESWIIYSYYRSVLDWKDGQVIPREENIYKCWKSDYSTVILITSSKSLDKDLIHDYPLYFADNTRPRFNSVYGLNVKQYALSEESYHYWKEMEKVTENLGTLFDPQPSSVYGNIHNVNNKNEIVLGYFDASTVQEKQLFLHNTDVPRMIYPVSDLSCESPGLVHLVPYEEINEMILNGLILCSQEKFRGVILYLLAPPECVDCRLRGSNIKPDYWLE